MCVLVYMQKLEEHMHALLFNSWLCFLETGHLNDLGVKLAKRKPLESGFF